MKPEEVKVYRVDEYCEGASRFSFSERKDVVLLDDYKKLQAENAKLKCLALHGMIGYATCKMNLITEQYKDYEMAGFAAPTAFTKWHKKKIEWTKAYRKAKKELKE